MVKMTYQSIIVVVILAAAYLQIISQEHTYEFQHETTLADLNCYMATTMCLLITLMDATIMYTCIWLFA